MRNIIFIIAIFISVAGKAQVKGEICRTTNNNNDTLVIPLSSPVRIIKVGDTYYEITKPELKKVEKNISVPMMYQNWGGLITPCNIGIKIPAIYYDSGYKFKSAVEAIPCPKIEINEFPLGYSILPANVMLL